MDPNLIDLFEQARQGDRSAMEQLLVALSGRSYRYALVLLRHPQDAEDATQEVASALIECIGRATARYEFGTDQAFEGFVFTITARTCLKICRKRQLNVDPCDVIMTELLDPFAEDDKVGRADDVRCVLAALDTLPEHMRKLLEQRYLLGLSSVAIANLTQANEKTVRSRLMAARSELREAVMRTAPALSARLFGVEARE